MGRMMREKKKIAKEIVDFWYIIELLTQEKFPKQNRRNKEVADKIRDYSVNPANINDKGINEKRFTIYTQLNGKFEIKRSVERGDEYYRFHPESSSIGHVCYGKIEREAVVRKLYEVLDVEDERHEQETDDICFFAFKRTSAGEYEKKSLQISPLIWGVYKCHENEKKKNRGISHSDYHKDIESIEKELGEDLEVSNKFIDKIYDILIKRYVEPLNLEEHMKNTGVFVYSRFKDFKTKESEEEKLEDISELIKSFYSDDLSYVSMDLKRLKSFKGMRKDVVEYVTRRHCLKNGSEDVKSDKIDISSDKEELESVLSIENVSLGKWPSRFKPALMQQVAINYGMFKDDRQSIFSVNGPPGTGKTTLLKEIIAHNIVERAIKLSDYDKPDDAFKERTFKDGKGEKVTYHKYFPKYFVFKDESLNHHGMLVASNNNAAVENITVELPNLPGILKGLSPNGSDDEENRIKLIRNRDLFDISKCTSKELYREKRENPNYRKGEKASKEIIVEELKEDIYFSWLAHKILNKGESETDPRDIEAWGIISAPLGKKSNLNNYYYNVLRHFIETAMKYTSTCEARVAEYEIAKDEFLKQLEVVRALKKELVDDLRDEEALKEKKRCLKKKLVNMDADKIKLAEGIEMAKKENGRLAEDRRTEKTEFLKIEEFIEFEDSKIRILKEDISMQEKKFRNIGNLIKRMESKIGITEKLLYRFYKTEKMNEIESEKQNRDEVNRGLIDLRKKLKSQESKRRDLVRLSDKRIENINKIDGRIDENERIIKNNSRELEKFDYLKEKLNSGIEDALEELRKKSEYIRSTRDVLDVESWDKMNSDDEKSSTEVQLMNPWITSEFDREREKLFYHALQLHKNFILSSKRCRCNFNLLAMMWGYTEIKNEEGKSFASKHREEAFPHLLNTLFLLTPVISTTFASTGRFLKDVKKENSIGLLIIDEAGQATPQIALGALWRARKAIIVGDPKQVEPVVTSDSEVIRKAFSNDIISSYQSKQLSVQGFADSINPIGSFIKDKNMDVYEGDWVGCPLLVHRRCINPMFDISNEISYANTMKYQTKGPDERESGKFLMEESCWIDISGLESGYKNHYVKEQGDKIVDMIKESFHKNWTYGNQDKRKPSLYIISPFTTVINGLRDRLVKEKSLYEFDCFEEWLEESLGTVHKFQGKEASEVIFVLGCDKNAMGAVRWVNSNILNVAVTRAKYRFYIIGDYDIWTKSEIFKTASKYLNKLDWN